MKAHTARLDALKACKAEIVKAPTPKAMTETPLEGARAQRLFCSGRVDGVRLVPSTQDAMMILKAKMMAGK